MMKDVEIFRLVEQIKTCPALKFTCHSNVLFLMLLFHGRFCASGIWRSYRAALCWLQCKPPFPCAPFQHWGSKEPAVDAEEQLPASTACQVPGSEVTLGCGIHWAEATVTDNSYIYDVTGFIWGPYTLQNTVRCQYNVLVYYANLNITWSRCGPGFWLLVDKSGRVNEKKNRTPFLVSYLTYLLIIIHIYTI